MFSGLRDKITKKINENILTIILISIISLGLAMMIMVLLVFGMMQELADQKTEVVLMANYTNEKYTELQNNFEELFKNQQYLDNTTFNTSCSQKLSQKFFDNMVQEIILVNELNTSGQAYQLYKQDVNILKETGCWAVEDE